MKKELKIVTIGGGTGQFTLLLGIKNFFDDLTAIVNMVDDGGSTGILRDELGVLPPGDVRQCLVALSQSSKTMRDLFNYRFEGGNLKGHNFGNLFLTALEKTSGSFEKAIEEVSDILSIQGKVIPVTTDDTHLCLRLKNNHIIKSERRIGNSFFGQNKGFINLFLDPEAKINSKAKEAILMADVLIIGPGSFYSSIVSNFLVKGMTDLVKKSKAVKIYICNLVNKPGQTDEFRVVHYADAIEKFVGYPFLDIVVYNNNKPEEDLLLKYKNEGENLIWFKKSDFVNKHYKTVGSDLISKKVPIQNSVDKHKRSLIRHDPEKLAEKIKEILENEKRF